MLFQGKELFKMLPYEHVWPFVMTVELQLNMILGIAQMKLKLCWSSPPNPSEVRDLVE
jgi:hypothetical protein